MKIIFFQCSAPSFLQPSIIAAPCSTTNIQIFFASSFFWKFIWIEKHKMAKNVLTLKTRRKRKTNQIPMKGFLFERYHEIFWQFKWLMINGTGFFLGSLRMKMSSMISKKLRVSSTFGIWRSRPSIKVSNSYRSAF